MRTDPDPALLEAAFLDHPSGMCVLRLRDLTFVAVNPAFEEATGWPAAELLGRRPDQLPLIPGHEVAELLRQASHLSGASPDDPRDVVTRVHYVAKDGTEGVARLVMALSERGGERSPLAAFTDASVAVSQEEAIGRRDAILEAAGFGAQMFLRAERWEDAIADVLRRIGGAANVCAHVFENVVLPDGAEGTTHRFEWCAPGIEPQIDNPDTIDQPWGPDQDDWRAKLAAGEAVVEVVRAGRRRSVRVLFSQGIVSILDVPIFAGREWWGSIGFDECERERHWTRAEESTRSASSPSRSARRSTGSRPSGASARPRSSTARSSSRSAVAYVNLTGEGYVPLYTSPGIEEMLGVSSRTFMEDRLWFGMVHPDDRDRVFAEDARTEETLEPFAIEYRMIRPDGKVVWVLDQAEIVRDERGQPRFWSGVMFDITSLKRAEEDLARALDLEREASARLRSLDELKNTFLQAVSHDLRTPLAAVLGSALTLEREDIRLEPEVERDLARRIALNARKLQRLVTDLLDLDRLSRGLTEPNRTDIDLADVVRTVAAESEFRERSGADRRARGDAGRGRRSEGRAHHREPAGQRRATHAGGRPHLDPGPAGQRGGVPRGRGRRAGARAGGPRTGLRGVRAGRERVRARARLGHRADAGRALRRAARRARLGRGA